MKRFYVGTMGLLIIGFALVGCVHQPSGQTDAGWITLFDGSNLDSWSAVGKANWRLEDGLLQADKGNGYLVSKNSYGDFQIRAEFWVDDGANSGIFIRCADPQKPGTSTCYEVNIYDKRPDPAFRTGAIVDVARPLAQVDAANRWSVLEISARGAHLTVTFNESPGRDIVGAGQARAFTDSKGIATFVNVDVLSPENGVYEIEGRGILKKVVRAVPGQMAKTEVMVLI